MAKKVINERCPLHVECERKKCEHIGHELECPYYEANAREELIIEDQEAIRRERWRKAEEEDFERMMADLDPEDDEEDPRDQSAAAGKLVLLPVDRLYPHPDNPRKNVGDVSELAESIKTNGILQNLTVVVHGQDMYDGKWEDEYRIIIGHRRYTAAKLAGLTHVPCVIAEMTPKEQVQTMLLENMQRSDLTVYEQAQGFQMMLDMGSTMEEIVEKSGFSKTTVRRRLEMAKLDSKTLKKVSERQLTLSDFDDLAKVDDMDTRNKLLKSMGTANFQNELKNALEEQRFKARIIEWLQVIQQFATEDPNTNYSTHEHVRTYNKWRMDAEVEIPEDADTVKYVYKTDSNSVSIYKERDAAKEDAVRAEREEKERISKLNREERKGLNRRHFELRCEFVKGLTSTACKKHIHEIAGLVTDVMWAMSESGYNTPEINLDIVEKILGVKTDADEDDEWLTDVSGIRTALEAFPEKTMLALAYSAIDGPAQGYWKNRWMGSEYRYSFEDNENLNLIYGTLAAFGYEMSSEEEQAKDGKHPLFPDYDAADPCVQCKTAHPTCDKCCKTCTEHCNAWQDCHKESEGQG